MAVPMSVFIAELKAFDDRRVVVKAMRRAITKPLPEVRKKVKAHAAAVLPHRGGLGEWTGRAKVTASIRYASARTAGVKIKGSRSSLRNKSDLQRLDGGTVRHPSWGRRAPGAWHTQQVPSGWFSDPVTEYDQWRTVIDQAVDVAFDRIRKG